MQHVLLKLLWKLVVYYKLYANTESVSTYQTGCGPSLSLAPRRPEVFPDEIQSCSITVSSSESLWGALNPPRCCGTACPQIWGAPPGAPGCPQESPGRNETRRVAHHRCRAGFLRLPPEKWQQKQRPSRLSSAGKVQPGVRRERSCVVRLPGCHLSHVYVQHLRDLAHVPRVTHGFLSPGMKRSTNIRFLLFQHRDFSWRWAAAADHRAPWCIPVHSDASDSRRRLGAAAQVKELLKGLQSKWQGWWGRCKTTD